MACTPSPRARWVLQCLSAGRRFFDLRESYGVYVVEGRARIVTVTLDGRRHEVSLADPGPSDKPVDEIGRLLRVWYGALRALSVKGEVTTEPGDQRFLEAGS